MRYARVIVDLPIDQPLDYRLPEQPVSLGSVWAVPVGRRKQVGIVVGFAAESGIDPARVRPLGEPLWDGLHLPPKWLDLCRFAADYYHYAWGQVALPALPPRLRRPPGKRKSAAADGAAAPSAEPSSPDVRPTLRAEQAEAIQALTAAQGFVPHLLFGVTGSGKTEVYLGAIERVLAREPSQVLFLVPEINLTPQLQGRLARRFPTASIVSLHSGMTPGERAAAWIQAHEGRARIVLGTRTAVFASVPHLALIVVDEEHDASFKAQGGVPYSARDLAVKRAQIEAVPIVLGSATPALETWQHAQHGRYRLLALAQRAGAHGVPPAIEAVDLNRYPPEQGLSAPVREAVAAALERSEQALIFLNRRGFAPVLRCGACEWLSRCPHCDAFAAYHKAGAALRCHHCGWSARIPASCPDCGNQDLEPVGQGTQRIEETLREAWPEARIARIDRDSTRGARGLQHAEAAFDAVHAGEVDILVGTQMVAKGHDFQRVSAVGILNADAQLVAADFRAPERLFALLTQVAGRAGRAGQQSRVLVQTRYPQHPLFAALARNRFAEFAQEQLEERSAARMPPFVYQALLRATARTLDAALAFLEAAARTGGELAGRHGVTLYDAVPMPLARLASESRGQLLVEAARRADLHGFLDAWLPALRERGSGGVLRWDLEVDPQSV